MEYGQWRLAVILLSNTRLVIRSSAATAIGRNINIENRKEKSVKMHEKKTI